MKSGVLVFHLSWTIAGLDFIRILKEKKNPYGDDGKIGDWMYRILQSGLKFGIP